MKNLESPTFFVRQSKAHKLHVALLSVMILTTVFGGCVLVPPPECDEALWENKTECEATRLSERCFLALTPILFLNDLDSVVLQSMPAELTFLLENKDSFDTSNHPLKDVVLGTVMGAPAELEGCWARVQSSEFSDGSDEWVEFEWMTIDFNAARLSKIQLTEGFACSDDPRPFILLVENKINNVETGQMLLDGITDNDARTLAGINPDGSLSFHFGARLRSEFSNTPEYERKYTVNGDVLATSSNRGEDQESVELWFRVDCSAPGSSS